MVINFKNEFLQILFEMNFKTTKNSIYEWLKNINKLWNGIIATAAPGMAG